MARKKPYVETPKMTEKFHQLALQEETPEAMRANHEMVERDLADRVGVNAIIDHLKAARLRRKMTLDEVAKVVGIAKPHLSRLENHPASAPKIETLNRYAAVFGYKVDIRLKKQATGRRVTD